MATTTQTTGPAPWAAPYFQSLWNGGMQVANRPYEQYQGPRVAGMSDITQGALSNYYSNMNGNPVTWGGMGLLGDVIGGQYGNPQTDKMASQITADAGKAFDSKLGQLNEIFSNPNSFGNSRHALGAEQLTEDFGKGLGSALTNLRYGAFNDDMSRRLNATGQAQSITNSTMANLAQGANLGNIPRGIQQQIYDTGYQDWKDYRNYPMQQTQFLANIMGMGNPGSVQSTQTPDPSRGSQIAGGALLALNGLNSMGAFSNWGSQATPTQDLWMNGQPIGGFASNPWYG